MFSYLLYEITDYANIEKNINDISLHFFNIAIRYI